MYAAICWVMFWRPAASTCQVLVPLLMMGRSQEICGLLHLAFVHFFAQLISSCNPQQNFGMYLTSYPQVHSRSCELYIKSLNHYIDIVFFWICFLLWGMILEEHWSRTSLAHPIFATRRPIFNIFNARSNQIEFRLRWAAVKRVKRF